MPVRYVKWFTRELLRAEPDARFVFGDNCSRVGYRGQAAACRDEPNAIGVATASGGWGAATASGYQGAATASGSQGAATASGKHAIAMASGPDGKVRGEDGCDLVLREFDDNGKVIARWIGTVGHEGIKPMTWYRLKGGKPVEVD